MYKIKETIIVEGIYDKIKLSRFIDGTIFVTNGFRIFSDKAMLDTIKKLSAQTGVVIFTDSDSAGFKIRNFIKQALPAQTVKHAYAPNILGKEKRKTKAGREGLLGVEGLSEELIVNALKKAGCIIDESVKIYEKGTKITKAHFYADGLSGSSQSAALRRALCKELGLPLRLSSNMLLDVLNRILSYEEYCELVQSIKTSFESVR
ncbi:MAG: DUF4093 domain-containing protein [Clostridia bacterium]|nr:DUF4093 domain-containing protein [Clostridia bacterium]